MFFSTYVLTKKGPLAKVWLAAHWERKLTKNEVKVVNLRETIVHIIQPVVPIAIRTSGELLIGVVRIYALKVKHLLRDATEASVQLILSSLAAKNGLMLDKKDSIKANPKANVNTVTLERGMKHREETEKRGRGADGAFHDIADLLGDVSMAETEHSIDEDLRSSWYAMETLAQGNEMSSTQQDFDDIAKMRADLLAFRERGGSGSTSTSNSKSSLSSIEKTRGSHALEGVPFPPVTEDLDIGMPLPEELPMEFPVFGEENQEAEDPFFIPELLPGSSIPMEKEGTVHLRKIRPVNVLDLAATTLSRETIEKNMNERADIVDRYGARHGPVSEEECAARYFVQGVLQPSDKHITEISSLKNIDFSKMVPFSSVGEVMHPDLLDTFASVLLADVEKRMKTAAELDDALPAAEGEIVSAIDAGIEVAESFSFPQEIQPGRKRGRDEGTSEVMLSGNAAMVLEKIKQFIERPVKKSRKTTSPAASCSFKELVEGANRREVAKIFVDVLSLLSKRFISVEQQGELGQLVLHLQTTE